MRVHSTKPSSRYLARMRLVATIIAVAILAVTILTAGLLGVDWDAGLEGDLLIVSIVALVNLLWWLAALFLTAPYYRSLRYEIQDDEVVVHAGIWTKSVKHVPYRTVTNLTVKRDILDRGLGIGTLNIQTAGMSGQTGAEERLVGLDNVQTVYEAVAAELRRFRAGMAPTQAGVEVVSVPVGPDAVGEILAEVRAIRRAVVENPQEEA